MCQNITWSLPHSLWSKGPLSLAANRSEATNAGGDRKTWRFCAIPLADSSSYIYMSMGDVRLSRRIAGEYGWVAQPPTKHPTNHAIHI